jgi:hypothetical protein
MASLHEKNLHNRVYAGNRAISDISQKAVVSLSERRSTASIIYWRRFMKVIYIFIARRQSDMFTCIINTIFLCDIQ